MIRREDLIKNYQKVNVYAPREDQDRSVYLFHNRLSTLTKIGFTGNVSQRLMAINTLSGVPIDLLIRIDLVTCDINAGVLENYLHTTYKNQRALGEWFYLSKGDIYNIRKLFYQIDGIDIKDYINEYFLNKQN